MQTRWTKSWSGGLGFHKVLHSRAVLFYHVRSKKTKSTGRCVLNCTREGAHEVCLFQRKPNSNDAIRRFVHIHESPHNSAISFVRQWSCSENKFKFCLFEKLLIQRHTYLQVFDINTWGNRLRWSSVSYMRPTLMHYPKTFTIISSNSWQLKDLHDNVRQS